MVVVLWIVSGLLALIYLGAGGAKLLTPKAKLQANPNMAWTEDFSQPAIKAIGAVEVLGALGLILPMAIGIAPVLTPLAAIGLAALQVGAILTHRRRHETKPLPINITLLLLAVFAGIGWFTRL